MKQLITFLLLFVPGLAFAQSNQTESLTISTYYPAPYGVYRNLKLSPTDTVPSGSALSPGVMFYNNTGDLIQYYNNAGKWVSLTDGGGAFWAENATTHNIYNTNSARGTVSIETTSPVMPLMVTSSGLTGMSIYGKPDAGGGLSNNLVMDKNTGKGWDFATRGAAYPGCSRCASFAFFNNTLGNSDYLNVINWNRYPITMLPDGSVGINGTNPQPGNSLDVGGKIHATGDICTDQGGGKCLSTSGGGGGGSFHCAPVTNSCNCFYTGCPNSCPTCNVQCPGGTTAVFGWAAFDSGSITSNAYPSGNGFSITTGECGYVNKIIINALCCSVS